MTRKSQSQYFKEWSKAHPGYAKNLYHYHKEHNLCVVCGDKVEDGKTMCPRHRENARKRQSEWKKRHTESTRAYYRMHAQQYRREIKKKVLAYYGNKCACCGESTFLFLTIDHINSNGAEHRKQLRHYGQRGGWLFYKYLIDSGFPLGYQTLCYNCNLGRAKNKGVCPHKEQN